MLNTIYIFSFDSPSSSHCCCCYAFNVLIVLLFGGAIATKEANVNIFLVNISMMRKSSYAFPAIANRSCLLFNAFICSLNEQTSIYICVFCSVGCARWPNPIQKCANLFRRNCTNFACLHKKRLHQCPYAIFHIPCKWEILDLFLFIWVAVFHFVVVVVFVGLCHRICINGTNIDKSRYAGDEGAEHRNDAFHIQFEWPMMIQLHRQHQ